MSTTPTLAEQARDELAHRSLPKADRPARPTHISPDVWKLGGADLRALAGDLAQGITTHVEARRAARDEARASKPAPATRTKGTNPNTAKSAEIARNKLANTGGSPSGVSERDVWVFAARALKAAGHPVPRHISRAAKVGTLAAK